MGDLPIVTMTNSNGSLPEVNVDGEKKRKKSSSKSKKISPEKKSTHRKLSLRGTPSTTPSATPREMIPEYIILKECVDCMPEGEVATCGCNFDGNVWIGGKDGSLRVWNPVKMEAVQTIETKSEQQIAGIVALKGELYVFSATKYWIYSADGALKRENTLDDVPAPFALASCDDGVVCLTAAGTMFVFAEDGQKTPIEVALENAATPALLASAGNATLVGVCGKTLFVVDAKEKTVKCKTTLEGADVTALVPVDAESVIVVRSSGTVERTRIADLTVATVIDAKMPLTHGCLHQNNLHVAGNAECAVIDWRNGAVLAKDELNAGTGWMGEDVVLSATSVTRMTVSCRTD